MNLKRTVYHIAGKDYNENEWVKSFTITAPLRSIQNIVELIKKHRLNICGIKNCREYPLNDYAKESVKDIIISGWPGSMTNLFITEFNLNYYSELRDNFRARNSKFRADKHRPLFNRINFYSVFDPATKTIEIKSNSPRKIEGKQAVINGKLWRKLPVKY